MPGRSRWRGVKPGLRLDPIQAGRGFRRQLIEQRLAYDLGAQTTFALTKLTSTASPFCDKCCLRIELAACSVQSARAGVAEERQAPCRTMSSYTFASSPGVLASPCAGKAAILMPCHSEKLYAAR